VGGGDLRGVGKKVCESARDIGKIVLFPCWGSEVKATGGRFSGGGGKKKSWEGKSPGTEGVQAGLRLSIGQTVRPPGNADKLLEGSGRRPSGRKGGGLKKKETRTSRHPTSV